MARPARRDDPRGLSLEGFSTAEAHALLAGEWLTWRAYPGLRLCATAGTRTWTYRYRSPVDGRLRQIRLGRWPAVSWAHALVRWEELSRERDAGKDPQLERKQSRRQARAADKTAKEKAKVAAVTVDAVLDQYMAEDVEARSKSRGTVNSVRSMFRHIRREFGSLPAVDITIDEAEAFLKPFVKKHPGMAILMRSRAGRAWAHAMPKLLPRGVNPWREAFRGSSDAPRFNIRKRVLVDSELAVFLARLPTSRIAPAVADALLLTLLTGARSGEVCKIEPYDLGLADGCGTWTLSENKTDAPRTVRLPRQAMAILGRYPRGFLRLIRQRNLSDMLRDALAHFGLKQFTPHDLRRSARTGLARLGVRDEVAEAALGHARAGIKGVYDLHRYEKEVGEALQKWADHLDSLQPPSVTPFRRRSA